MSLPQDVRFALRMLATHRLFAVIAIGALAIGIGATTAIYSVVDGVLLRPLSFPGPDELVVVLRKNTRSAGNDQMPVAPANYRDAKQQNRSFTSMGAAEVTGATLSGDGPPEQIGGLRMTASVFEVLGTQPVLGRVFRADEEEPGRDRVIVLTHRLWQRRFGGEASVIGRTIRLSGESFQVIGVMPEDFRFPQFWATGAEMYIPLAFSPERWASRGGNSLRLFARLLPGVTISQARADLDTIAARLAASYPQSNTNVGFSVKPLHDVITGKVKPALLMLLGAVGFVLLIACANVASLLVTRGIRRRREIAVRTALGAGRRRIVRQLLTESMLLSILSGFLGVLLALWILDAIQMSLGDSLPRVKDIAVDAGALLFAIAASLVTGIVFGLAPALQASRADVNSALKENARSVHGGGGQLRRMLVASEVALTVVLLVGAGLLTRSFVNMLDLDPGFRRDNLLTAHVNVTGTSVMEPARQTNFYRSTLESISALPGVTSAAAINHLPLAGDTWSNSFLLNDRPAPAPGERFSAVYRIISPGYFRTMKTRVLSGREFENTDVNADTPVAVINQAMAKRYWPATAPLSRRLRFGGDERWVSIVGVVENVLQHEFTGDPGAEIYLCYLQQPNHFGGPAGSAMTFVVRTAADPYGLVKPLQSIVWSQDARIPFTAVATMDEVVSHAVRQPRVYAVLLGLFAFVALLLATMGLYGVISYTVAQRTQEMGVRMAVGASAFDLIRLVVAGSLKVVAVGAVTGLLASLALSQFISTLLFGLKPNDLFTICGAAVLIFIVAAAAAYIPARRVSRIDPLVALRVE
jgi:putative ABC transport system permease protein